jgi:regulatory protein
VKADGPPQGGEGQAPEPPTPSGEVLNPALRLLSGRVRSIKELKGRLLKKGLDPTEVTLCIRWLEARGYLDDEAFAQALTRDRIRFSPRSPFLMIRELKEKGVAPSLAERVVERVLLEEEISALDLAAKAAEGWVRKQGESVRRELLGRKFTPGQEKVRRRLYGFLARRGFAGDTAREGLEAGEKEARRLGE